MYNIFENLKGRKVKVAAMTSYERSIDFAEIENELINYTGVLREITPYMIILDGVQVGGQNVTHPSMLLKIGAIQSIQEIY